MYVFAIMRATLLGLSARASFSLADDLLAFPVSAPVHAKRCVHFAGRLWRELLFAIMRTVLFGLSARASFSLADDLLAFPVSAPVHAERCVHFAGRLWRDFRPGKGE